ncbi:MAG: ankyrin repeat domain-containing protein [Phycisphaerae bacterium]|nr:ankyrin repeat domain-containing protein [Phycisphaerae bacterium]
MRGKLSLHTVLELTFVLVFVPAIAVAAQDTRAKSDRLQGGAKSQKVEQPANNIDKLNRELVMAVLRGQKERAEGLIAQGADVNAKLSQSMTMLHMAVINGDDEGAVLLLNNGALVDAKDENGRTPLHLGAGAGFPIKRRNPDMIGLLLDNGADVNAKDNKGLTALHYAAVEMHREIIVMLLECNMSVNVKDNVGRTPLHYAAGAALETVQCYAWKPKANSRNIEIVKLLIEKGLDVNIKDKYSLTPLHYATVDHSTNIMALLLNQGAFVDVKDNVGRTPLHYAAGAIYGTGHVDIWTNDMAILLLDKGADINAQDNIGWAPLHYSAYVLNKDMVEYFIQKGADLHVVDKRGYTPYLWNRAKASYYQGLSNFDTSQVVDWQKHIEKYNDISRSLRKSCNYYVASDGRDTNPGTLGRPFRTIAAVIDIVDPGDVIFIRGGIHHCPSTICLDKSGEQDKPICIRPYPGEIPILDFSGAKGDSILITGAHWRLKGLTITHGFRGAIGLYGNRACHNVLEQMKVHDNRYAGIRIEAGAAYNILLNCDSYHNFDLEWGGEDSDGFGAYWNIGKGNILIGNRAWSNSDDGYDLWDAFSSLRIERCYAWRNGENIWNHSFFIGNANGFKLGRGEGRHVLIGCLAWGHSVSGYTLNGNTSGVIIRNCTAWDNDTNYAFEWSGWKKEARESCVFSNNISYNGRRKDGINPEADTQHNSWDASFGLTLTDNDFLSLDDSTMSQPRNPDGSIPQNDFLRLDPSSAAVDKGVDVSMPFVGVEPDLGAFEYNPNKNSSGYVKMLHQAVRDHDLKQIEQLLAQGEGINDKDWLGYTPLHWAVYFGYSDLTELLISKGADPDIQSNTGRYALEIARAMAYPELEALLRKLGAKACDVSPDESNQPVGEATDR